MRLPIYQVDAFAERVFGGNPAAVCPLPAWLDDAVMQAVAAENNLSETAFFVRADGEYAIRWFTPAVEVDLCGHATLASAHVVFTALEPGRAAVRFESRSGPLDVTRDGELLVLDFPARPPRRCEPPAGLGSALGAEPREVWLSRDLVAVFEREDDVRELRPDMGALGALHHAGVCATAPGDECDFVSRFFAPAMGVPEDPVTGSSHCTLVPFWAERLGRTRLRARQVSTRGGELHCEHAGERVRLGGRAVRYLEGFIEIP
jgi:predicted PhzF superfamily epimerase YddE/YHI9